jgi:hemoglobin
VQEQDVYAVVGEPGITRVVAAFYRRVPSDDVLGPMYPPEDLEGAEQRLRDFLIYRFGGPQRYIEQRGHPRLRARDRPPRTRPLDAADDRSDRRRWTASGGRGRDADVSRRHRDVFDQ